MYSSYVYANRDGWDEVGGVIRPYPATDDLRHGLIDIVVRGWLAVVTMSMRLTMRIVLVAMIGLGRAWRKERHEI